MFTLVACLVVVGVSAAAVLWQTRGGALQTATEPPFTHRQSGYGHGARPATPLALQATATGPVGDESPRPVTAAAGAAPDGRPAVARRGLWRRLQAAGKLLVLVVVIGTLTGAVVGGAAALIAFAVREAVK